MKIVFATNNPNKLKEIQSLIPKEIEIISLMKLVVMKISQKQETHLRQMLFKKLIT